MLIRSALIVATIFALAAHAAPQNANTSTTTNRQRTQTGATGTKPQPTPQQQDQEAQEEASAPAARSRARRAAGGNRESGNATDPTSRGVLAAFNSLLDGIRAADVEAVTSVYWNSPQLVLFNNNGTVTKGWKQMRENRESSYPNMKDVKLEVRDVRVQMLGRDGALVTCLWTQSQTFRDAQETATGRMTLAFRRVGGSWKAVHLHTSPDAPDPARVLPSEQTPAPTTPAQKPKTNR